METFNDKFEVCFKEVAIGLAFVDLKGKFICVNKTLCQFLGYEEKELIQVTFQELSLAEDLEESFLWIKASLAGEIEHSFTKIKRYRHKAGHLVWAKVTTTLIRNKHNEPDYFLSSIQDISELKQAENALDKSLIKLRKAYKELQKSSSIDGLTGVYNITSFKKLLYYSFEQYKRYQTPATLVFIDLNGFKSVNDVHGHLNGDKALISLATKLQNIVRQTDSVGRYGGDEFAVLLSNTSMGDAADLCARIGNDFDFTSEEGEVIKVGMSVGISPLSTDIYTVEQWLSQADELMYKQKKASVCTD